MKYLTPQDILLIHAKIIDETGGLHGIRDIGLLVSITERPKMRVFGRKLYEDVFRKAAVYLEGLTQYHVFSDGNKRTGITATARFLFRNGVILEATNKDLETFVLKVAVKRLNMEEIASWLQEHSRKMKR